MTESEELEIARRDCLDAMAQIEKLSTEAWRLREENDRLRTQSHEQYLREVAAVAECNRLRKQIEDLQWKHTGQKKAMELLQKGFESTCEQHDALKQSSRATAAERDRLREQVASLRKAARAITATTCAHGRELPNIDDGAAFLTPAFKIRALAKALEETAPTQPPSE